MNKLTTTEIKEIVDLHLENISSAKNSLKNAIKIGGFLHRQKANTGHGAWLPWLKSNVPFSDQTARNYMRVYDHRADFKTESVSDLTEAYRLLNPPKIEHETEPSKFKTVLNLTPEKEPSKSASVADLTKSKEPEKPKQESQKPVNIGSNSSPMGEKTKLAPQRKDAVSFDIPSKILPLWDRAEGESKSALNRIQETISAVKDAKESDDIIYGELSKRWQDLLINLENVKSDLKRVAPYAVCVVCQGQLPEKCRECFGKGFVSKMFWDESVAQEFKEMRKKSAEKNKK